MLNFLIVVDMQNDFVSGSLGTKEAQGIVDAVARRIRGFEGEILYTMDTHSEDYMHTQEGSRLPVKHCIVGTDGWALNVRVQEALKARGADGVDRRVLKETFGSKHLPEYVSRFASGEDELSFTLIGLCTDICVISNAMILKAFFPEAPIFVDAACCAGVTKKSHENALEAMRICQMEIIGA